MSERLFSLFRKERERLEIAIAIAQAKGAEGQEDARRLQALHRAVNDQIRSWTRDLQASEDTYRRSAA